MKSQQQHLHTRLEPGVSPKAPNQQPFSLWLDFFRWMAALLVVITHCDHRFLLNIADVPKVHRTAPLYFVTFFAGFGHRAVIIFFVLSGYLVGGSLWREAKRSHTFNAPLYFLKRLSRLCIVLYPAFLLILILNQVGVHAFHGIATQAYPDDALQSTHLAPLACNAAFLDTALCNPFGSDGALWSLFNEFWYYITWPLLVLAYFARPIGQRLGWLGAAAAAMLILTVLPIAPPLHTGHLSWVAPYMLIWLLGVPVSALSRPLTSSTRLATAAFVVVVLGIRLGVRNTFELEHPAFQFLVDLLLGATFANLLLTLRFNEALRNPFGGRWHTWLAAFSFSLYCIHIPVLNLCSAALRQWTGQGPKMLLDQPWKWGATLAALLCTFVVAYLFSLLTETNTVRLRLFLERKVLRTQ